MYEPTTTGGAEPQGTGTSVAGTTTDSAMQAAAPSGSDNAGNGGTDGGVSVGSSTSDVIATGGSSETGNSFELVRDPVTGKRTIRRAAPQPEQPPAEPEQAPEAAPVSDATPTSDQAQQAATEAETSPAKYTLEEFSAAIASGNVEGSRVPEEYQQHYANYKIQQAMQAYNESQKQVAMQREQVEKQLTPEEAQKAKKEFYERLNGEAKERALKDMGLTSEQLSEMELEDDEASMIAYKTAYDWHRQELINEVQQRVSREQEAKAAQQNIYKGIMSFVEKAKVEEPNFNAIDQIMQTRYKTLPYEKGRAAEEAIIALRNGNITEAQTETLRQYYEDVRKEFYAEKNKLSTTPKAAPKPPIVEQSGNGTQLPKNNAPDYSALRNAGTLKERKAWLQEFFNANRTR